jgi:hypothetical protein
MPSLQKGGENPLDNQDQRFTMGKHLKPAKKIAGAPILTAF